MLKFARKRLILFSSLPSSAILRSQLRIECMNGLHWAKKKINSPGFSLGILKHACGTPCLTHLASQNEKYAHRYQNRTSHGSTKRLPDR